MGYNKKGGFMDIILASKSKRRIEMMDEFKIPYRSIASTKDEFVDSFSSNEDLVMKLAKQKAMEIFNKNQDSLVLGFDTLVFIDNKVLGKPQNENECIEMIKELSGKMHTVSTGGYIVAKDYQKSFATTTNVYFEDIDIKDIVEYSKTSEPYDKAGGYAVQGFIGRYIKKIEGDIFSVIGMPKSIVYKEITNYIKNH